MTVAARSRTATFVAGLALFGIAVPVARALEIQVTTVRATEQGQSDPVLVGLRPQLRRIVGARSYQVVSQERRRCTWRNAEDFALPAGVSMHLLPRSLEQGTVVMQVRLLDGRRRIVHTDVRLRNRGTMVFGMGHDPHGSEGSLIVLLKAEE